MFCAFCRRPLAYVHGHATCVSAGCPLRGANQAECCDGETAAQCPAPTSSLGRAPPPPGDGPPAGASDDRSGSGPGSPAVDKA